MADAAISVTGLRKSYGEVEAVAGIDLEVRHGEVLAFLGPNGAGKTTTVEILEGYRSRSAGEVRVLGVDPAHPTRAWRDRIGIVLQSAKPEPFLTVRETVSEYAGYYSAPRAVDETIERVGLADSAHKRIGKLSGGQQRRLDVALALVGDPDLVFLDEPTTGFDPAARRNAWRLISGLRELGKTVFLTTHYMDEAQELADRVMIIARGRIVAEGTPGELVGRDGRAEIRFRLPAGVAAADLPVEARVHDGRVVVTTDRPVPPLHALTAWAMEHGHELADLEVERPSLEDVYLELTGAHVSSAGMAVRQIGFDVRAYLRNPPAVFFGLMLPVLFLLIFATIFGNETIESRGGIKTSTYYVPGLVALGIISTTFVNLAVALVSLRENRVLKRLRGTPLPPSVFLAGRVAVAVGMSVALTVVLVGIGRLVYGVSVPGATLPAVVLALVVGGATFCCLGAALSTAIPNEDAAVAIVNAVILPLYFISGVFFPTDEAPAWLNDVASVFPVKHLAEALLQAFDPATEGVGIAWGHVGIVAAWGLAGLVVAVRTFRWTPRGE